MGHVAQYEVREAGQGKLGESSFANSHFRYSLGRTDVMLAEVVNVQMLKGAWNKENFHLLKWPVCTNSHSRGANEEKEPCVLGWSDFHKL